jgi:hypothetical protein
MAALKFCEPREQKAPFANVSEIPPLQPAPQPCDDDLTPLLGASEPKKNANKR